MDFSTQIAFVVSAVKKKLIKIARQFLFLALILSEIILPLYSSNIPLVLAQSTGNTDTEGSGASQVFNTKNVSNDTEKSSSAAGSAAGGVGGAIGSLFSCPRGTGLAAAGVAKAASLVTVPVHDTAVLAVSTITADSSAGLNVKECILNGLLKAIARALIHEIVSSIIDWINNGFQGGPTFVTDPAGFFGDIADQELGRYIDGTALGFVCDPFRINLQFAFLAERSRYRVPSRCTITGIIRNFKNFTNGGNFSDGGWRGWIALTTQPQNNEYGGYLLAKEQISLNISGRQNLELIKLNWGRGFRSLLGHDGTIKTPGALIEYQLNQATGNDLSWLNLQREFDDIIVALINLGITKVINQGLRS